MCCVEGFGQLQRPGGNHGVHVLGLVMGFDTVHEWLVQRIGRSDVMAQRWRRHDKPSLLKSLLVKSLLVKSLVARSKCMGEELVPGVKVSEARWF